MANEAIEYPIFEVLRECRRAAGLDGPERKRRTADILAAFRRERRKLTTKKSGDYGARVTAIGLLGIAISIQKGEESDANCK